MENLFFGLDIGRSDVKAQYGPDKNDVIIFPSYVANYRQRDLKSESQGLDNLEVTINKETRFIGELAREMDGAREFGSNKVQHENTLFLMLTAIALAPTVRNLSVVYPRIVVGLPINNYTTQATEFERRVAGEYVVTLPGKRCTIVIDSANVRAFQEGVGAFMDMALGSDGKPAREDLFHRKLGFLDVGFKTVNFFVMDRGRFIDSQSGTLERLGMSDAYLAFYKRISREKGVKPGEAEILFNEGQGRKEIQELAIKLEGLLAPWWPDPRDFDIIYISGGGGIALKDYFVKYPVHLVPGGRTANASGFRKVALAKLGVK